jgi:hypothetical protein
VTFNGTTATTIGTWTASAITATVPTGATTGPVAVTVSGVTVTSGTSFTVLVAAPTPIISPGSGTYAATQVAAISDSNPNATIYYTLGTKASAPTTASNVYYSVDPMYVGVNGTLEAMAVVPGDANSAVATAVYTIQAPVASFSPPAGNYVGTQTVTLSGGLVGQSFFYTTNGNPATTSSTPYSNPVSVSSTETINAVATSSGMATSADTSATYNILSAPTPPTFTPAGGAYTSTQLVTLSDTTSGVTIYYTTNGSTPNTSSTAYTGAISVGSTETIKAIAVVAGSSSTVATANYTLPAIANSTTALAVTSGGSPVTSVASGSQVTLTATVASGATAVTNGAVNFCDATATFCTDVHLLGTAQLTSAGTAAINLRPGIGSHSYLAKFLGTSSYATSESSTTQSSAAQLTVTGTYPTTTTISGTRGSAGNYTLTTQVAAMGSNTVAPTGIVSILDTSSANSVLGTGSLSSSNQTLALTNLFTQGTGYDPESVSVGDFNGDGIPDLAVLNGGDADGGTVSILLGNGDGTFTPAPNSPSTGSMPNAMVVGDFNGDGNLDLAVVGDGFVTILLGNGKGGFEFAPNSPITDYSAGAVAVGDFNGDGKLDLVMSGPGNSVSVWLGNGDGTFTPAANSPVNLVNNPGSIAVGDFNGDGKPDLAVTSQSSTVSILLGNGDGTFRAAPNSPVALASASNLVAVGDFRGIGTLDLVTLNIQEPLTTLNGISILLGNGDGSFSPAVNIPVPYAFSVVEGGFAVGDFNKDGKPDLGVAFNVESIEYPSGTQPAYSTVAIMLGNGDGTFGAVAYSPAMAYGGIDSFALGDFNGDGIPDLALTDIYNNTATIVQTNLAETATATVTGIAPTGIGTHNVDASYSGNTSFAASASATTPLTTVADIVSAISPTTGPAGTVVTITGLGFGGTQGTNSVTIGGISAVVTQWSNSQIQAQIPNGPGPGPQGVVVTVGGQPGIGAFTFTVTPAIIGITPSSGLPGNLVNIAGTNFGTTTGTVTFNGISATITNWTNTSIQTSVPTGATTGNVVVTAAGVASNGVPFIVAPYITNLSVTSGAVNTSVTITGTSFGTTQGTVTFNGTPATTITNWTDTSIQTSVPTGATTGNVVVTAVGVASNGVPFTVAPGITTLSPTSGVVGSSLTITGTSFGTTQGTVTFNGTPATTITNWTNTSIQTSVPTGATSGNVVVTVGGVASNGSSFTVLATPGITNLSVTSGAVNTPVTITGSNFGTTQGTVTFNGTPATTITNWTDTSIQTSVPTGATTGNVVVTADGVASNGVSFTVAPGITNLSVTSGEVNTPVTITGTSFGTMTGTVTFNGTPATTITNWTDTSIQTSVPTGATTGNVVVTAAGVASNGVAFTVLTVTLTSSANPSSYGGSVIFTATFSTSGLTGPVTFFDSGTQIGAGTITGTTATYKTSSLAVGAHSITASWPGTSTYAPITSSPVLQTVQNTPAVYSWPFASNIASGQTLASSQLIGGSAAVSGTFAWTAPGTIPPVGASTESMTFTPSDTTDYSSSTGSVAVTVDPIESPTSSTSVTYTYDNLGRVYQAQYSTSSGTITVTYSYDSAGNRTSVVTQ